MTVEAIELKTTTPRSDVTDNSAASAQQVSPQCSSSSSSGKGDVGGHDSESVSDSSIANSDIDKRPSVIPITTPSLKRVRFKTNVEENGGIGTAAIANGGGAERAVDLEWYPYSYVYLANACCELLHYREAALVVGGLESVTVLAWIGALAALHWSGTVAVAFVPMLLQLLVVLVTAASIGLMIYGVVSERPLFIWPHMLLQLAAIATGILLTVVAVVTMAAGTDLATKVFGFVFGHKNIPLFRKVLGPIWPFCLAVIFDFSAAVGIWFYILVRGCYDFLEDKLFFENRRITIAADQTNSAYENATAPSNMEDDIGAANVPDDIDSVHRRNITRA